MRQPQLRDRLDLDGDVVGQAAHADGRAGVAAAVAQDFDQQVRTTVDHARVMLEFGHAVDHAEDLHHAGDIVEPAGRVAHQRQKLEAHDTRMAIGFIDGDVGADLAGEHAAFGTLRTLAGNEEQRTRLHPGHVIGDGFRRRWKNDAHGGQPLIGLVEDRRAHPTPSSLRRNR